MGLRQPQREIKGGIGVGAQKAQGYARGQPKPRMPGIIPARFAPIVFGLILSGLTSCFVSGLSTFRTQEMVDDFGLHWMGSCAAAWALAFPTG